MYPNQQKNGTSDGYMVKPKKKLILTKKPQSIEQQPTPNLPIKPQYFDPEDKKYYKTPIA